jgi:hypothetical protein
MREERLAASEARAFSSTPSSNNDVGDELERDEEDPALEDSLEMKERLSREREMRLAQKKKARSKETVKSGKRTKKNNVLIDTQPDFVVAL